MRLGRGLAGLLVAVASCAGCGGVAGSDETTPVADVTAASIEASGRITALLAPATGSAPPPAPRAEPAKQTRDALTVWLLPDTPDAVIKAANKRFTDRYPNVDVDVVRQDWSTLQREIDTKVGAAETTPDVLEVAADDAPELTGRGLLADLTADRAALRRPQWTPAVTGQTEVAGRLTSVPLSGQGRVVAYDPIAWKSAGVSEQPRTLAEFADALERVQASGVRPDYSALWLPGRYWQAMVPWIWAEGGELATEDQDAWAGAVDSSESQAGLMQVQELGIRFSKAPLTADATSANQARALDEGRASAALLMPYEVASLSREVEVFALPGREPGTVAPQLIEGSNLAVSASSSRQALAIAWLTAFLDPAVQQKLATTTGAIPGLQAAVKSLDGGPVVAAQAQLAARGKSTPATPNWAEVTRQEVLADLLQALLTPTASPTPSESQSSPPASAAPSDPAAGPSLSAPPELVPSP